MRQNFTDNFNMEMPEKMALIVTNGSTDNKIPHVLTVAGSDSGELVQDYKSFLKLVLHVECFVLLCSLSLLHIYSLGPGCRHSSRGESVVAQLKSVLSDMHVDFVKTGMLDSTDMVEIPHDQCTTGT